MKNIKKCPLFIILFSSGLLFTLLAAGGLRTIYQTQQFEWQKEPLLAVVFRGLNEEIYPWQLMTEGNEKVSFYGKEMGLFERLVLIGKLYLGNNKSFIVSEKFIDLEGVFS